MNLPKSLLQILLTMIAASQLTACAKKTVQWEEEVPLNTGETIWVKRMDTFKRGSEPGNPLKSAWWIKERELEFTLRGKQYKFHSDTTQILMIYQLEVANGVTVVAWTRECFRPGYGEFRWVNGSWQLQKSVSQVLIGKPRNLMGHYSEVDGEIPTRVTQEYIRNSHFDLPQMGGLEKHLSESRIAINCSGRK